METIIRSLAYLAGTVFVIMFAVRFFNNNPYGPKDDDARHALSKDPKLEPALPRYVTEKTRYNIYLGEFIFFTIVLYYFISLVFPVMVSHAWDQDIDVSHSIALVLGTLGFISLSSKIPHVKRILTDWKEDLHRRAKIPDKAMYVFDVLRFSEVNRTSQEFKTRLKDILNEDHGGRNRRDIDRSYFFFAKDRIERKWSRLVYLMYAIEYWGREQQFERHLKAESLKWLALRSCYRNYLIPTMEQYRQGLLDEKGIESVKSEIETFSIKIYWLITLLLFMANKAAEDPCIHLKRLGWIVSPDRYFKFATKQIVFTGGVVFLSILVGSAIGSAILMNIADSASNDFNITPASISRWLIYGIPMFVTPLVVTLFVKRYLSMNGVWIVRRPEEPTISFSDRSWDIYFFTGILSYMASLAVLVGVFFILRLSNESVDPSAIEKIAVYSGLAFITSGFISYRTDTFPSPRKARWRHYLDNIFFALLQGLSNIAMIMFAFLLFEKTFDVPSLEAAVQGRLIIYTVIGFVVGVSMHLTSGINMKYCERRGNGVSRSSDGWWTICVDSVRKRVKTRSVSRNALEIMADDELKELAGVGDRVEFYSGKELAMTGSVKEVTGEFIHISIAA